MPAFSLMEPIYAVEGDIQQRNGLTQAVDREIVSASREGRETSELQRAAREFTTLMEERNLRYRNQLLDVNFQLTQVARLLPLSHAAWTKAQELYQAKSLRLPDAIVAASVYLSCREHSPSSEMCFVTRDNHFKDATVRRLLSEVGCDCLFDYHDAAGRLRL